MELVRKKISDLKFAPFNPRQISPEELENLKSSITTFGFLQPIIWNQRTGNVVGGNQRLKALIELKETETDVVVVDLNETEEKMLNIALNKISGEWDEEKLKELLSELKDEDIELTGFSEDEIKTILEPDDVLEEKELDETIKTENVCPKCGYSW